MTSPHPLFTFTATVCFVLGAGCSDGPAGGSNDGGGVPRDLSVLSDLAAPADGGDAADGGAGHDGSVGSDGGGVDGGNLLALGSVCVDGASCESGSCVDGVCCDSVCDGACEGCLAARTGSTDGACAPVLASLNLACRDGEGLCDTAEVCDGTSAQCPADAVVAAGVECRVADGPCDVAEVCDGLAGACPADAYLALGTPSSCGLYTCDGGGPDCPMSCASDSGCAGGLRCVAGLCGARVIFVTSVGFTSGFGSLAAADAECTQLATGAGLGGSFRAWLSDDTGSPATRLSHSARPYVRVDGAVIANQWSDLTDGALAVPINVDESGATVSAAAGTWSQTRPDGGRSTSAGTNACGNWNVTPVGNTNFGSVSSTSDTWSRGAGAQTCAGKQRRLYCVQHTDA